MVVAGIPTLNRYDLLAKAVAALKRGTLVPDRIIIVDNGGRFFAEYSGDRNALEVLSPGRNLGCAGGWNTILRMANASDVVCLLNDDLEIRRNGLQKLVVHVEEPKEQTLILGGPKPLHMWSVFALRKSLVDLAGYFDEGFWPAFFEDTDYARRLKLLSVPVKWVEASGEHVGSGSTFKASNEKDKAVGKKAMDACLARYVQKWGGPPGSETLESPLAVPAINALT